MEMGRKEMGESMIKCSDCIHGKQEYCCSGCDMPSDTPLGGCLHYVPKDVDPSLMQEKADYRREEIMDDLAVAELEKMKIMR